MRSVTRRSFVAMVGLGALGLVGCSTSSGTIEGSVDTVVEKCQELPSDASNKVVVSGNVWEYGPDMITSGLFSMSGSGDDPETVNMVYCNLAADLEEPIEAGERVTVSGTLMGDMTDVHTVWLENCEIV